MLQLEFCTVSEEEEEEDVESIQICKVVVITGCEAARVTRSSATAWPNYTAERWIYRGNNW